ncbi:hypothetical protein LSUB1_G007087 [Lachnellula subtilissima]|uniref:Fe2OG dioxygenase domain-containing protein n=1 Tax=Lachnellula subtilissima TaxID=602034 RepID=A0A8H8RG10_9HELO|nr:hypothetical protein LSUB1_G007087 [Lachnellula subtilissima]
MANCSQAISISSSFDDGLSSTSALDQMKAAVNGYASNYCCGGNIPITTDKIIHSATSAYQPIRAPPVSLRWDLFKEAGQACYIHFPLDAPVDGHHTDKQDHMFQGLLEACDPATFGLGGRDAGKLDTNRFSTNFHPHDYGIVDTISQSLLPNALSHIMKDRIEHRGVLAELYKLNVYSGPGGKFQAHVDTPRGATQFGSLVICLPNPFKGGQFCVTHKGHSTFFDWDENATSIQWAAFYSDCEHEVLEVTEGHRITLTYNLYCVENIGGVVQSHPTADAAFFPLMQTAKELLKDDNFMRTGGTMGFYCAHMYAHNHKATEKLMPFALKGIDVAIFSVFLKLGLKVSVRPVLQDKNNSDDEYSDEDIYDSDESQHVLSKHERTQNVGDAFHPIKFLEGGDMSGREEREELETGWPNHRVHDVLWLNSPFPRHGHTGRGGWEVAYARMAYGNQAELEWRYSHATIMVTIPTAGERGGVYDL